MKEKSEILEELGMKELLLPKLISDALIANDRAKYLISLLQMAKNHADNPQIETLNLKSEREECGIEESNFDRIIELSNKKPKFENYYYIPEVDRIVKQIIQNVKEMILPLEIFSRESTEKGIEHDTKLNIQNVDPTSSYSSIFKRFEVQLTQMPNIDNGVISGSFIETISSGQPKDGDGFHLIVMAIHKELNKLQTLIYNEIIDGARVFGISDVDKSIVRAFMKGVISTKRLKFEHPGLDTTVTRSKDVLFIENNIGTTDAHILVLKIKGMTTTMTYSDVHIQRIEFFHSLFERFSVRWHDCEARESQKLKSSAVYHVSNGTFEARNQKELEDYLCFVGSRIVFLIDWNRGRKCLRNFVKKKDAINLLKWAAENNLGHRAFLKMGGEQLIFGTLEKTMKSPLKFGDRFEQVLGSRLAIEFLQFVLRTCAEGLVQNRSEFLIRDEVRVELGRYLRSTDDNLLQIAANHASLIVEVSTTVRDGLVHIEGEDLDFIKRNAERAARWEKEADTMLNNVRLAIARTGRSLPFENLVSNADDAIDSLEETIFLLTLVSRDDIVGDFFESLLELAELAAHSSMEYLKAIENSKNIDRWSTREEIDDFLQAVDRIITIEHGADDVTRRVSSSIMKDSKNFKQLHILAKISNCIEDATDSLMKSAVIVKNYTLEEIISL